MFVCMYVCMHVCMFELQTLYVHVCFQSATSEHVCMSQAAERVCMYVCLSPSKPMASWGLLVSEGAKTLIKTLQNLTFINFF